MASGSGEVLSSLRGKIIELPESKEKEEWTPFNGEMHMQGIKVSIRILRVFKLNATGFIT